jgi:hypothetical protein
VCVFGLGELATAALEVAASRALLLFCLQLLY